MSESNMDVAAAAALHTKQVVSYATVASLVSRSDRRLKFESQGFDVFLGCPIKTLLQERHANGGRTGCFAAHRAMWQAGEDARAGDQAVFEDDAVWRNPNLRASAAPDILAAIMKIKEKFPAWDLIYLGGVPLSMDRGAIHVGIPGVLACPVIESHAYIMSPNFRRRALQTPAYGGVDFWLARTAAQVFCFDPELIEQDETSTSDIGSPSLLLAVRAAWKAHHVRVRAVLGPVPLRHVELTLLFLLLFAWGAAPSGSPARRWIAAALVVVFICFALDTAVMDAHLHDRRIHIF